MTEVTRQHRELAHNLVHPNYVAKHGAHTDLIEKWMDAGSGWLDERQRGSFRVLDGVAAKLAELTAERDDAREWVRTITTAERTLTCVYCGHAYPPGTPAHGSDTLTAHISTCEKHPMRLLEERIAELESMTPSTFEYLAISRALEKHRTVMKAAKHLKIGRATLCRWLNAHPEAAPLIRRTPDDFQDSADLDNESPSTHCST